ncbi:hypothetical protein FRC02_009933 [Tulasnella sp. 418]|nr:hypothetical protein FRC02_009933 [Tulasnella sp. 418]
MTRSLRQSTLQSRGRHETHDEPFLGEDGEDSQEEFVPGTQSDRSDEDVSDIEDTEEEPLEEPLTEEENCTAKKRRGRKKTRTMGLIISEKTAFGFQLMGNAIPMSIVATANHAEEAGNEGEREKENENENENEGTSKTGAEEGPSKPSRKKSRKSAATLSDSMGAVRQLAEVQLCAGKLGEDSKLEKAIEGVQQARNATHSASEELHRTRELLKQLQHEYQAHSSRGG